MSGGAGWNVLAALRGDPAGISEESLRWAFGSRTTFAVRVPDRFISESRCP